MANLNDRLDIAIQEECEEIKKHPTNPDWRLCRKNQSWIVADLLIQSGDHPAAAQAAADMLCTSSDRWQDCYDAACLLARCVALAMEDETRSPGERRRLARSYAAQAVRCLKSAMDKGFHEFGRLARDPDLRPLRNHSAFGRLAATKRLAATRSVAATTKVDAGGMQ